MDGLALRFGGRYRILDRGASAAGNCVAAASATIGPVKVSGWSLSSRSAVVQFCGELAGTASGCVPVCVDRVP